MVSTGIMVGTRVGAYGMKYMRTAFKIVKRNWKGITGQAGVLGGALYLESIMDDDDMESYVQGFHPETLTADEKAFAVQSLKDTADDFKSGEIWVPFSKRLNEFIEPTHIVTDIITGRSWGTNNYISPAYVKAIQRNTVSRSRTYRKKR